MSRLVCRFTTASGALLMMAVLASAQQQTTTTETKSFEVISVQGNDLVVKLPEGTRELDVPEDFRFVVDTNLYPDGPYALDATAVDAGLHFGSARALVYVDNHTKPAVQLLTPGADGARNDVAQRTLGPRAARGTGKTEQQDSG